MIDALAIAVPALPGRCAACSIQLARTPTAADRVNIAGALATAARGADAWRSSR